jgi:imidazolonepropionase
MTSARAQGARSILLVNIGQLLTLRSSEKSTGPRRGKTLSELGILEDAAILCLGGRIVSVGKTKEALRDPWIRNNRKRVLEIDCKGQVVLPGFVDSHTHPVFINPRLVDFEKRAAGGNLRRRLPRRVEHPVSVEPVHQGREEFAGRKVLDSLHEMAEQGTTTVEGQVGVWAHRRLGG